jgi:hypothetical protein
MVKELVPLWNYSSEGATCAFLNKVFSRFGALAKVIIDKSTKFCGEFQKVCEKTLIDHHMISWDHLEANMLAK